MGKGKGRNQDVKYQIEISDTAKYQLKNIKDERIKGIIISRIEELCYNPEKQGKALIKELAGIRSIRTAGQRYRIIFKIEKLKVIIYILAIGIRKDKSKKDIYHLAKQLIKLGLVD